MKALIQSAAGLQINLPIDAYWQTGDYSKTADPGLHFCYILPRCPHDLSIWRRAFALDEARRVGDQLAILVW